MTTITAAMVKDLRDKTGAGMMDCKAALNETNGDMEAAIDWLRKKGISKAAKKAGRAAAEGLVGVAVGGNAGALVEVNAETDFVARNDEFKGFVKSAADIALREGGDLEKLLASKHGASNVQRSVAETRQKLRQQGFKTDLADFNLRTDAAARTREAALNFGGVPFPMAPPASVTFVPGRPLAPLDGFQRPDHCRNHASGGERKLAARG